MRTEILFATILMRVQPGRSNPVLSASYSTPESATGRHTHGPTGSHDTIDILPDIRSKTERPLAPQKINSRRNGELTNRPLPVSLEIEIDHFF